MKQNSKRSDAARLSEPPPGGARPRSRTGWWGVIVGGVVCLAAVVFVAAQGLGGRSGPEPAPAPDPESKSATRSAPVNVDPEQIASMMHMTGRDVPAALQTMLEGSAPAHLEYDAKNNRHWWAPHNHWHDGPPPATAGANVAANLPAGATPVDAPPFDMNAPAVMPDGSTPGPWDYDAVNNRHWHPGHAHWHQGPPPPPEDRQ